MPPVPRNETWTVGWIQACTQMEFFNTYGDIGMWVINNPIKQRQAAQVSICFIGRSVEFVVISGRQISEYDVVQFDISK